MEGGGNWTDIHDDIHVTNHHDARDCLHVMILLTFHGSRFAVHGFLGLNVRYSHISYMQSNTHSSTVVAT